jgi:hypothetical protein
VIKINKLSDFLSFFLNMRHDYEDSQNNRTVIAKMGLFVPVISMYATAVANLIK